MKEPKCSYCGEIGHYKINCFKVPKKPIKTGVKSLYKAPARRLVTKTAIYPSKPKPLRTKPVSRRKLLIKELDTIFSLYIRRKASQDGVASCVTCWKKDSYKFMDCGHFLVRGKIGTRYDEKNCHVQCRDCNRYKQGNMKNYKIFMLNMYGQSGIDALKEKSKQSIPTFELEAMLKYYKEKLLTLPK